MHWLTTERARLGVLVANNMLLYVTGGAAGSEIRAGQVSCATPIAGAIASCGTRTEWAPTGGLGVEAMFAPHWSAKVEWLYTSFGTHPFYTVFIPVNVKEDNVNIIRAGINWHFKPPRQRRLLPSRCRVCGTRLRSSERCGLRTPPDARSADGVVPLALVVYFIERPGPAQSVIKIS